MTIIAEVIRWGVTNNASKKSCQTLLDKFDDGGRVRLALALVENAAVVDGGRIFAIMTYIFEGDDPLILSGYRGFEQLDETVGIGSDGSDSDGTILLPSVDDIAPTAIRLLDEARKPIQQRIDDGRSLLEEKKQVVAAKEQVLAQLITGRAWAGAGGRASSRATTVQDYSAGGTITTATEAAKRKKDAEADVKKAKKEVATAQKTLDGVEKEMKEWDDKYGMLQYYFSDVVTLFQHLIIHFFYVYFISIPGSCLTKEGLLEYGRLCIPPGHKKYKEQFVDPGGRCTNIRKAAYACQVFEPFVLKKMPVNALELLVDQLRYFETVDGQPYFSQQFLALLKTELPKAKEHAEKEFDWDSIPKSRTYRDRSERRAIRRDMKKAMARVRDEIEDDDDPDCEYEPYDQSEEAGNRREPTLTEDWKDDLGEYGRRIWEWWLLRWLVVKEFDYFGQAIRKVVLWKLSSAMVERDFSQFVAIKNACGSNVKKPMLQNRMYCRCNRKDYETTASQSNSLGAVLVEVENEQDENDEAIPFEGIPALPSLS